MSATPLLVVAAVIERSGRLLLGQRPRHKHHGGLWEFPGGKVDPGESLEQAIARELREELAIDDARVEAELFRHLDPARPLELVFLRVVTLATPTCLEHEALVWVDDTLRDGLELAPADALFYAWYSPRRRRIDDAANATNLGS
jgi:mutator protein MutT